VTFRYLSLTFAVLLGASALPAAAQIPVPAELPWNAPPAAVRARLARLGLQEVPATGSGARDSTRVFVASLSGATAQLTAQFRAHRFQHALVVVEGDSASVQRVLDRYAAAVAARHGQAARSTSGSRGWTFPGGRRFTLPTAPSRLENGKFGFGVAFHRG